MADCTCTVRETRREWAHGRDFKYAVRIDEIHDDTEFDPACPFHGESGSMVAVVSLASTKNED